MNLMGVPQAHSVGGPGLMVYVSQAAGILLPPIYSNRPYSHRAAAEKTVCVFAMVVDIVYDKFS